MATISVVICCANVDDTLEAACRSVSWTDDLVIVDSGSTDGTAAVARRHAHRYLVEPWRGFTEQKRFAASLARHDWVFSLDGDEACTPALARELAQLDAAALSRHDLFEIRRRHFVMGRPVGSWSPDWSTRLFHRGRVRWTDDDLHDRRVALRADRAARLDGWIEHRRGSRAGFRDFFDGELADARLRLIARELHAKGRRCRWIDLAIRPPAAFLKSYVLKRGCLDGTFGLMMARQAAYGVHLKYSTLWAIDRGVDLDGKRRLPSSAPRGTGRQPSPRAEIPTE